MKDVYSKSAFTRIVRFNFVECVIWEEKHQLKNCLVRTLRFPELIFMLQNVEQTSWNQQILIDISESRSPGSSA